MKLKMRFTHDTRIKWVRLKDRMRRNAQKYGWQLTISTRKLGDGSYEGEMNY